MNKNTLQTSFLETRDYEVSLNIQRKLHDDIANDKATSTVLFAEHAPVITLGKHASQNDVLMSPKDLLASGIRLFQIDRGGQATAHEPGQLVIYPLIKLRTFHLGSKQLVHALEETVIELLRSYSICAHREECYPGVWVRNEKICSIGLRIRDGVSYHGLALNVCNSLETFKSIIPCGIQDRGLTSISKITNQDVQVFEPAQAFLDIFGRILEPNS